MWKDVFKIITNIVSVILISIAVYWGIFKHDYAQASFLLLLVLLNKD